MPLIHWKGDIEATNVLCAYWKLSCPLAWRSLCCGLIPAVRWLVGVYCTPFQLWYLWWELFGHIMNAIIFSLWFSCAFERSFSAPRSWSCSTATPSSKMIDPIILHSYLVLKGEGHILKCLRRKQYCKMLSFILMENDPLCTLLDKASCVSGIPTCYQCQHSRLLTQAAQTQIHGTFNIYMSDCVPHWQLASN
jgi:hypothetical protein